MSPYCFLALWHTSVWVCVCFLCVCVFVSVRVFVFYVSAQTAHASVWETRTQRRGKRFGKFCDKGAEERFFAKGEIKMRVLVGEILPQPFIFAR